MKIFRVYSVFKTFAFIIFLSAFAVGVSAAPGIFSKNKRNKNKTVVESADSAAKEKKYKPYDEVIKGAVTDKGLFTVHRVGTDYYFEIPDSLFGRDFLIVNKISSVPSALNDAGVNKGMGNGEKTIRFHKDTLYRKVWVTSFDPRVVSPKDDAITLSVKDNYRESVIEQFEIETIGKDSASVVIKVNKIFDGSEKSFNDIFGDMEFHCSPNKELSRIDFAKSFPLNIIVRSSISTTYTEETSRLPLTVGVTSNIILLDKKPMKARFGNNRIGYFANKRLIFNDRQQRVEERELINRWRLEPKDEDIEKYLRGELVEPRRPIVFHIDPSTPPLWVPYIIAGVKDWQAAFEKAGFKNAIIAKEVDPNVDTDFDIDDVRYSVITYAASENANAMGPSVVDPRSGEIIEADIIWWHNVMDVLHAWIRLQTGAVDPAARGAKLPDELMGNAIRFVSSHELGHSLGLKHNFGASYSVPVDSLRSKTYTDNNGTASSIMDYARFNYVAQPGDGVTQLTPQIGTYDKHAIDWGYRWFDTPKAHDDLAALDKMIRRHDKDYQYWYGEQSREGIDPRSQSEDLGNEAVKASLYGLANLKRIIPHVADWTYEDGELMFEAGRFLNAIVAQWFQYAGHVSMNIGGIYLNNLVYGQPGESYVPVPAAYQKKCVKYLVDEVLNVPEWLFSAKAWTLTNAQRNSPVGIQQYFPYNLARAMITQVYWDLVSEDRLLRMYETEAMIGKKNTYTPDEMLADITKAIFIEKGGRNLTIYERMSQKAYVDALIVSSNHTMVKTTKKGSDLCMRACECDILSASPEKLIDKILSDSEEHSLRVSHNYASSPRSSETTTAKRAEISKLFELVKRRGSGNDSGTRSHYKDLELRLKEALKMTN